MRTMTLSVLAIAALGLGTSALAAIGSAPVDPTPAELEAARLKDTAFEPLANLATPGRNLRRVSYADIHNEYGQTGVLIEKMASGEIQMTVVSNNGKIVDSAILSPDAWTRITAADTAGLAPRKKVALSKEVCIGASVVVEAVVNGKAVRRDGEMCTGAADTHTMEYARVVADVAQKSIPRCAGYVLSSRDASWTLRDCVSRSLVALYKINPYNFSSANNNEPFQSYALKSWNNVTPEVLATFQKDYRD